MRIILAVWVLMYFSSPALGDTIVFGWRGPDGEYAFTDNPARIPAAYKDTAIEGMVDGLDNYRYYTHDDHPFTHISPPSNVNLDIEEVEFDEEIIVHPEPERRRKRHRNPNKR